jgi:esterase
VKLHYRILGEKGQPIIILHGLFGTSDNWQTLGKAFAHHNKVFLVDARNHGHSPHTDEMDYFCMAEDVKELIADEKIDKPIIIGHSMGGKTAMYFAQQYPELLDKLVVVDMGAKKYPPHHQQIFDALLAVDLNVVKMRKEAEAIISSHFNDAAVVQFLLKNLYWDENQNLAWRMNLPLLIRDIDNILQAVLQKKCFTPALFIRGGKSNYIMNQDWQEILELFPNATLETLENAGHWVHAEAPKEFHNLVNEFIKKG